MQRGPRIHVVGISGSGKSTVGSQAATRLGVPYIELDAVHHGPNWTEIPDEEFRRIVTELVRGDAWVIDGNYRPVRDLVWARATTVVWLDLPKWLVMAQVVWRSVTRAITREEMWHPGNRESVHNWLDPEHPIRWAWSRYGWRRAEFASVVDDRWIRLRSRAEIQTWLDSLLPA